MSHGRQESVSGWRPSIDLQSTIADSSIQDNMSEVPLSPASFTTISSPSTGGTQSQTQAQSPINDVETCESKIRDALPNIDDGLPGWLRMMKEMTRQPGYRAVARFEDVNLKNLLYYQVEIARLKKLLAERETNDYAMFKARRGPNYCKNPAALVPVTKPAPCKPSEQVPSSSRGKEAENLELTQWEIILRIRTTLREYNDALLQYHQVALLPTPTRRNMQSFHNWLQNGSGGRKEVKGTGSEAWNIEKVPQKSRKGMILDLVLSFFGLDSVLEKRLKGKSVVSSNQEKPLDLVSLLPEARCDPFSLWIADKFFPWYWEFMRKDEVPLETLKAEAVSGEAILRFTSFVATMVACALPIAGIAILAAVKPMSIRISIIAAFSFITSGSLLLLAKCRRMDVFMATAAFSAVLVVFVQNA